MIFLDDETYPVDMTKDGGDSLVRAGILSIAPPHSKTPKINLLDYYLPHSKELVRHPRQAPWNFPGNLSRDQLMMALMALNHLGHHNIAKELFYAHAKRIFFCQNFYRDWPIVSKKYPFPHRFYVDSKRGGEIDYKLFDFADILLPNHIGCLIIAGKIRWAYFFLPICFLFHLVSLFLHSKVLDHYEENQAIAESYLYKTLCLFDRWNENWVLTSYDYWVRRNEPEYHKLIKDFVHFNNC